MYELITFPNNDWVWICLITPSFTAHAAAICIVYTAITYAIYACVYFETYSEKTAILETIV